MISECHVGNISCKGRDTGKHFKFEPQTYSPYPSHAERVGSPFLQADKVLSIIEQISPDRHGQIALQGLVVIGRHQQRRRATAMATRSTVRSLARPASQ